MSARSDTAIRSQRNIPLISANQQGEMMNRISIKLAGFVLAALTAILLRAEPCAPGQWAASDAGRPFGEEWFYAPGVIRSDEGTLELAAKVTPSLKELAETGGVWSFFFSSWTALSPPKCRR